MDAAGLGPPSWETAATSITVYLPTPEDLAARNPDAYKVLIRSGYQALVALPLRSGGHTLGILTQIILTGLARPSPTHSAARFSTTSKVTWLCRCSARASPGPISWSEHYRLSCRDFLA